MDRRYKHFNQAAVFNAPPGSVLEPARAVASDSFGEFEVMRDGFAARGVSGWHNAIATFRVAPVPEGTRLTGVPLLHVPRRAPGENHSQALRANPR